MSVAFDALSTGGDGTLGHIKSVGVTTTNTNIATLTITPGATATLALVFVSCNLQTDPTWTVKFGGTAGTTMTEITSSFVAFNAGAGSAGSSRCFGLVNPATGSAKSIAISATVASNAYVYVITFSGTATSSLSAAVSAWTNSNSALANPVTTAASPSSIPTGDMAVCIMTDLNNAFNTTYGNTGGTSLTRIDEDNVTNNNCGACYISGNGSTITMTNNVGATDWFCTTAIHVAAPAAASNPFINYDFPNPQRITWYQHWQGKIPLSRPVTFNNFDWPNPRTYPPIDQFYSFENVQFLVRQPASFFRNNDQPNPYLVTWYRSWEFNNVQFISRQPASFFHSYDFPNPQPIVWYKEWSNPSIKTSVQNPFVQTDWPNPQRQQYWDLFYSQSPAQPTPINVIVEYQWDLPYPISWYRDWSQNLLQTTLQPVVALPHNNYDWPNPQPITWYQSWTYFNPNTFNMPFNQHDWPLPYPIYWYRDYNQNVVITIPGSKPFLQSDWPNPQPLTWYRDHNQNLVIYLPTSQQPFNQTDWPVPKTPQPIDQFWFQSLALVLPPPPPPVVPLSAGRWISPEEVISSIARKYGRIGGLASADSRTAAERKTLASIAAAHRWKK